MRISVQTHCVYIYVHILFIWLDMLSWHLFWREPAIKLNVVLLNVTKLDITQTYYTHLIQDQWKQQEERQSTQLLLVLECINAKHTLSEQHTRQQPSGLHRSTEPNVFIWMSARCMFIALVCWLVMATSLSLSFLGRFSLRGSITHLWNLPAKRSELQFKSDVACQPVLW